MAPILSLLLVVSISILITRVATVALTHTGLSREAARFQARSAFTGVGFTTQESEKVVNHPVRRRVVLGLMLVGNAGIVTAVSSLILTFTRLEGGSSSLGWNLFHPPGTPSSSTEAPPPSKGSIRDARGGKGTGSTPGPAGNTIGGSGRNRGARLSSPLRERRASRRRGQGRAGRG